MKSLFQLSNSSEFNFIRFPRVLGQITYLILLSKVKLYYILQYILPPFLKHKYKRLQGGWHSIPMSKTCKPPKDQCFYEPTHCFKSLIKRMVIIFDQHLFLRNCRKFVKTYSRPHIQADANTYQGIFRFISRSKLTDFVVTCNTSLLCSAWLCGSVSKWALTLWHVTHDMWNVTHDTSHVTRETWHVTHDTWQVTHDMWHVWGGEHSLKISAP